MAAIFIVLPGAIVVDVIDHVIRVRPFKRGVSGTAPLWTMASIEVARISTATG